MSRKELEEKIYWLELRIMELNTEIIRLSGRYGQLDSAMKKMCFFKNAILDRLNLKINEVLTHYELTERTKE